MPLAISKMGSNVDRDQLKPGDLVFFNTLKRQFLPCRYLYGRRSVHSCPKFWRRRVGGQYARQILAEAI